MNEDAYWRVGLACLGLILSTFFLMALVGSALTMLGGG